MPYFALFYDVVDSFVDRRLPYRPSHLALVEDAHRRGELQLAGALLDRQPAGDGARRADGALLVFRTDDASAVKRFVDADPYVQNGLVKSWRIREWANVLGDAAVR